MTSSPWTKRVDLRCMRSTAEMQAPRTDESKAAIIARLATDCVFTLGLLSISYHPRALVANYVYVCSSLELIFPFHHSDSKWTSCSGLIKNRVRVSATRLSRLSSALDLSDKPYCRSNVAAESLPLTLPDYCWKCSLLHGPLNSADPSH